MKRTCFTILLLLFLFGCQDNFDPPWLINKPRILGTYVSIEGRPNQNWPRPGESVRLDWLVADTQADTSYQWFMLACVAAPTLSGSGLCADLPFALSQDTGSAPFFELAVPEVLPAELAAALPKVLVAGVICARGDLSLKEGFDLQTAQNNPDVFALLNEGTECNGQKTERTLVSFDLQIDLLDQPNTHPSFDTVPVSIFLSAWDEPPPELADQGPCSPPPANDAASLTGGILDSDGNIKVLSTFQIEDSRLPVISRDDPGLPFILYFAPSSADTYVVGSETSALVTDVENFYLSSFTTYGSLDKLFSVAAVDYPQVLVQWTPPKSTDEGIPKEPFLTAFYFVLRDFRGGLDMRRRLICVR
ncbi:MAG: hypothetical protein IPJ88_03305 [Myxococcales bacterium]|nr:MAG: hypothetical protein IPJ88_03305 [Myxococcales bacterium]